MNQNLLSQCGNGIMQCFYLKRKKASFIMIFCRFKRYTVSQTRALQLKTILYNLPDLLQPLLSSWFIQNVHTLQQWSEISLQFSRVS